MGGLKGVRDSRASPISVQGTRYGKNNGRWSFILERSTKKKNNNTYHGGKTRGGRVPWHSEHFGSPWNERVLKGCKEGEKRMIPRTSEWDGKGRRGAEGKNLRASSVGHKVFSQKRGRNGICRRVQNKSDSYHREREAERRGKKRGASPLQNLRKKRKGREKVSPLCLQGRRENLIGRGVREIIISTSKY